MRSRLLLRFSVTSCSQDTVDDLSPKNFISACLFSNFGWLKSPSIIFPITPLFCCSDLTFHSYRIRNQEDSSCVSVSSDSSFLLLVSCNAFPPTPQYSPARISPPSQVYPLSFLWRKAYGLAPLRLQPSSASSFNCGGLHSPYTHIPRRFSPSPFC